MPFIIGLEQSRSATGIERRLPRNLAEDFFFEQVGHFGGFCAQKI
jgi:hypothetical protein